MTFSEVVEAIKTLSLGEKEEIQSLLEQFLQQISFKPTTSMVR
jgi:DNA-directed RNA polymerase delta subunit